MQVSIAFKAQPKCSRKDPAIIYEQFRAELRNFQHETPSWRDLPRGQDLSSHVRGQSGPVLPFLEGFRLCHGLRGCRNMQKKYRVSLEIDLKKSIKF